MKREILVSASRQESRVALLEDGQLVELMYDRPDQGRIVGDIYLGRVEAVLPGIQAAFVDIGTEKSAFLHVSDLVQDEDEDENGGGNGRRSRKFPPIQELIKKGDTLPVQVTKEPISTKGPRVTAQVSLPGRSLVYMPFSSHVGVSRKIEDREERTRLKKLGKEILPENSGGIIVRTVGEELTQARFKGEFDRLHSAWKKIQRRADSSRAPACIHQEAKMVTGLIRDLFSDKFESLTVDSREVHSEIVQYVKGIDPDLVDRVHLYDDRIPLFDSQGIEEEIQKAFQRKVEVPSGGHIVVEPTEALVSIDVNTGRFTGGKGKKDPEQTILRTNMDAAREIARQIRLRDIGGIVVCDFIDMESQENRDKVLQELRTWLGRDRARTRAFAVSELGLVEMTRQRVRPPLYDSLTRECSSCGGAGRIFTPASVIRRIERSLQRAAADGKERQLGIRVHPEVAFHVLEAEPGFMKRLAKWTRLELDLVDDPLMRADDFRLQAGPAETDVTERYATL